MRLAVSRFWRPKAGSTTREYEDALARWTRGAPPYRVAVADGASESSFARSWARLLAGAYARGALDAGTLLDDLGPLQACWLARVNARPRPWYVAEKVRAGAFAALAGVTVDACGGWRALAVGDCCVMHVRDGDVLAAFPLASAAEFDNRPLLIGSNPERNGRLCEAMRVTSGAWRCGDSFVLASDALAACLLRAVEGGAGIGEALAFERTRPGFVAWTEALRTAGSLRNDDVTLLIAQVT